MQSGYSPASLPAPDRRRSGGPVPSLSVVVAVSGGPAQLRAWLAVACRLCEPLGAEVIVCGRCHGIEEEFPSVSLVEAPATAAPAELRRVGLSRASGDIVLFTTDSATDLAERLAPLPLPLGSGTTPAPNGVPAGVPWRPDPSSLSAPLPPALLSPAPLPPSPRLERPAP